MIFVLIFVSLILLISIYYNYKFAKIILRTEDSLEKSLEILDNRYDSISKILEIPLFYDSAEIRRVVDDIRISRDSLLDVANEIASVDITNEDQNENHRA